MNIPQGYSQKTVHEIYTDYDGWWVGSSSSSTYPDTSHLLLGYKIGSTVYSTGVNDALLTSKSISFTPQDYKAILPANSISTQYVGVGFRYGGPGNVTPNPITNPPPFYLDDGTNGLDLGTALFNSSGSIIYHYTGIDLAYINDGIPDIIITQVGDPSKTKADSFSIRDVKDSVIGNFLAVRFDTVSTCGKGYWKFYNPSSSPPSYQPSLAGNRDIRIIGYDFADFGITASNYLLVKSLFHKLSGESDQAFVAFNMRTVIGLPIELGYFNAEEYQRSIHLYWQTISEENNDFFTVERSVDLVNWDEVKTINGAGNSYTPLNYHFEEPTQLKGFVYYRLSQTDINGVKTLLGIRKVFLGVNENIVLYPNPANSFIGISGLFLPNTRYEIYNTLGQMALTGKVLQDEVIDISSLPIGTYYITLKDQKDIINRTIFIKQ